MMGVLWQLYNGSYPHTGGLDDALSTVGPALGSPGSPGPDADDSLSWGGLPSRTELYVVMSLLTFLSIVGTAGNSMVLYVFSQKKDRMTSTLFILGLAFVDFTTCLVVIPYTIYLEFVDFHIRYDILCKLYQFLITCNIPFSALIMVAIAIDRYFCICHPFLHAINLRRAKMMIGCLGALATGIGVIVGLMYGVYQKVSVPVQTAAGEALAAGGGGGANSSSVWLQNSTWGRETTATTLAYAAGGRAGAGAGAGDIAAGVDAAGVDAAGVDAAGVDAAGVDAAGVDAAGVDAAGVGVGAAGFGVGMGGPGEDGLSDVEQVQNMIFKGGNDIQVLTLYTGHCAQNEFVLSSDFAWYFQKCYVAMYLICLIIVIILYVLIYRSVLARRTKRQKAKSKSLPLTATSVNGNNGNSQEETLLTTVNGDMVTATTMIASSSTNLPLGHATDAGAAGAGVGVGAGTGAGAGAGAESQGGNLLTTDSAECWNGQSTKVVVPSRLSKKKKKKKKIDDDEEKRRWSIKKDHNRSANLKTAAMLFVVMAVFVVTFLPAFLMALQLVPYSMTIFYMYFANNVANPVIYGFMNKNFRDDLKKLFCRR